jgi:hypothetical protein
MEKETSAYINMLTIEYARRKGISDAALFNGIEKFRPLLENPDEWIGMELCTLSLKNFETAGRYIILEQIHDIKLITGLMRRVL